LVAVVDEIGSFKSADDAFVGGNALDM